MSIASTRRYSAAALLVSVTFFPSMAMAQSDPAAGPAATAQAETGTSGGLEEIVVTAQRREQSLQKVPIAVSALTGEAMANRGIIDTSALNGRVPSLSISQRGPQNVMFIRGVGTNASGSNSEQSIAQYVDGVYIFSSVGNMFPFDSVERVEVLKGPQGTLFGRNATGGVMQIITKDPKHDPELNVSLGYANYNTITATAYGTTGLTDTLAANISVYFRDQGDGWGRQLTRGGDTYFNDDFSVRGKILWEPTDRTKVKLLAAYSDQQTSGFNVQVSPGLAGVDGVVRFLKPYDQVANFKDAFYSKTYTGSLQIEHDFDAVRLATNTQYRKVDAKYVTDQDGTPLPLVDVPYAIEPINHFAQEIRLESLGDGPLKWTAGGFYFKGKAGYDPLRLEGIVSAPLPETSIYGFQGTESYSLFGQSDYDLTSTTTITAGLRYTWEKVSRSKSRVESGGVQIAPLPNQKANFEKLTWRFALNQELSQDVSVYGSASRGFKSGGFNIVGVGAVPAYSPEVLDAYEVGLKSQLLDRRLRFNISAYLYKFKNIQVQLTQVGGENTANAAAATLKGIDVDFQALLFEGFTLSGAAGYAKGEYDSYPGATGFPASPSQGGVFVFDASGQRTVYTPKFSGNIAANYTTETDIGKLSFDASFVHSDSVFVQPTNRGKLPSYNVVNGSISWRTPDDRYGVRLWAANLFDERYIATLLESGLGDLQVAAPPRTFGITLSTKF
jgi:iron complex outermembrane recepter protein